MFSIQVVFGVFLLLNAILLDSARDCSYWDGIVGFVHSRHHTEEKRRGSTNVGEKINPKRLSDR